MLIEARYREEVNRFLAPVHEPLAELALDDALYRASCELPFRHLTTPVVSRILDRTETAARASENARAQPPIRLLVAYGPRADVREESQGCAATRAIVDHGVDWPFEG